jgi:hypothetical protein
MTTVLERGEGSASRPGRFLPPGKTRYPSYRKLGPIYLKKCPVYLNRILYTALLCCNKNFASFVSPNFFLLKCCHKSDTSKFKWTLRKAVIDFMYCIVEYKLHYSVFLHEWYLRSVINADSTDQNLLRLIYLPSQPDFERALLVA